MQATAPPKALEQSTLRSCSICRGTDGSHALNCDLMHPEYGALHPNANNFVKPSRACNVVGTAHEHRAFCSS